MLFECLSYMSYMYTRKHHKRTVQIGGSAPEWKDTFAINDKGGEIYQMQRTEAWFQGEHETKAWFQGENEWYDFSIASEYFRQCQRGRLYIKVSCH
jgi:hypothetical protein